MLNRDQRRTLLHTARAAVLCQLRKIEPAAAKAVDESLLDPRGAFVSLHVGEELRGCVGVIEADRPLIDIVASCAISAATADSRFQPVTLAEMSAIRFEISVLSPPHPIASSREVEIGLHGVIVTGAGCKALLLPQVATQEGWGADQLLSEACRKAGLPPAAWRGDAVRLEAFTAEVFGEEP